MKFARYLEETQTPEWKKAYIDYRGLKKRITAIKRAYDAAAGTSQDDGSDPLLTLQRSSTSNDSERSARPISPRSVHSSRAASGSRGPFPFSESSLARQARSARKEPAEMSVIAGEPEEILSDPGHAGDDEAQRPPTGPRSATAEQTGLPRTRRRSTTVTGILGRAFSTNHHPQRPSSQKGSAGVEPGGLRFDLRHPIPLMELLPQLTPVERAFFDKLDEELDKVESFYCEREREMRHRANLLKQQLQDLQDHRRAFYEAHPIAATQYSWLPLPLSAPIIPNILVRRRKTRQGKPSSLKSGKGWKPSPNGRNDNSANTTGADAAVENNEPEMPKSIIKQVDSQSGEDDTVKDGESSPEGTIGRSRWRTSGAAKSVQALFLFHPSPISSDGQGKPSNPGKTSGGENGDSSDSSGKHGSGGAPAKYDPEEYQHAKKQLKKAVLECYRGLELLNNYRTLNLIGFRKALKKFEKVTHIPAQQAYTREKIEPSAFSTGATVDALIRDMEALFAARFARGDKKKALARLRGGTKHTSHHFSTFRTGMFVGLAIPALADGLYRSFRSDTRAAIPGWDGLMYIYGIFFIPTLFSLLVGTNLLVWARARINYVFIFELDLRTRMDHRVYFEIPAFLLCLLCYAFWLSFARVGEDHISPTTWPLIWLAITAVVMFDPLPVMFKSSRWWLVKNVSKLLTSGMHRVEFADFWMGDQFCSLVFTLSNLYYVGCVYATGIDDTWRRCTSNPGPRWGIAFLLASLPLLVRLVQSVKRWVDSRLITHLINGGKYGSGIIYYLFYFLWREQGGQRGPIFVVWCVFATNYSLYAGAWDLLMDWSLLKPHAPYPLLRPNLLYNNTIPFYYFAIVTNILIRFIWVFYIPEDGPDFIIRTFIAGLLEALRRWQWNFLRLENEHLGNIDQYRVTREVPLPYSYDEPSHDSDNEDEDDDRRSTTSRSWRRAHRGGSVSDNTAAEVDA